MKPVTTKQTTANCPYCGEDISHGQIHSCFKPKPQTPPDLEIIKQAIAALRLDRVGSDLDLADRAEEALTRLEDALCKNQ